MKARQLIFLKHGQISYKDIILKDPGDDEVLVQAICCGISTGTERLIIRGEFPEELFLDESIEELRIPAVYPFSYGYILSGVVKKAGSINNEWMEGKRVLILHPHQNSAVVNIKRLIFLPDNISSETAVLIPSCETAVNLIHDASPLMGERVCIYGLGIIGQIAARMISLFPLENLFLVEPSSFRRDLASNINSAAVISSDSEIPDDIFFDLALELSGNPHALQSSLKHSAYDGRIVAGSWYGSKPVSLELGSSFHRKRLKLISSQVSKISPVLRGRWDYQRRTQTAIKWLDSNQQKSWITHKFPFENASEAYEIINQPGGEYLQVILDMN
ncbi:MAG: zinc-binding alcohol dehydrogenase [Spirochaetia bacterium]|jgi:2-desacetyl-2-hydroxyethyl bacteriochlorophyllide A dehydrogenase|nr:zinc-binding alcohol dehydrogenase [Spirochaetia bacterium]